MRALVYDRYGPPEKVLRLEHVPRPQPKPGEVLVRVHAASVNSWDWDRLAGRPLGRITAPLRPPHRILGGDIAGVVEAVGDDVSDLKVGDAVFGDLTAASWGGFPTMFAPPRWRWRANPIASAFNKPPRFLRLGCWRSKR